MYGAQRRRVPFGTATASRSIIFKALYYSWGLPNTFYNPHADILSLYLKNNIMLFPC
jgi:hypothetical protein